MENMNEYATYINVLTTSLRKKVSILEKLVKVTDEEEVLLKKEGVTIEEIEEKEQEKGKYLESLELADEGFEKVFQRIKYQYEEEIKTMQTLIKKITDMTVKIQAQEVRNKQLMEFFFQQKKRDIRSFHNSKRTVNQYQQNMVNRNVNGQAYFLDSKR